MCQGVELHVLERASLEPLALGLHLLKKFHDHDPSRFAWRAEADEFVTAVPALDLLTGSPDARHAIASGAPLEPLLERWRGEVAESVRTLEGILLYSERGAP